MSDETQAVLDRVRDFVKHGGSFRTSDLAHLVATVDALREDARRMDWLEASRAEVRHMWARRWEVVVRGDNEARLDAGATLRAALDAARTPTPEGR